MRQHLQQDGDTFVFRTAPEGLHTKVELYYSAGGINYSTYKTDSRGFWVSVTEVELEKGPHFTAEKSTPFSDKNGRVFLIPQPRKNAKRLQNLADLLDSCVADVARLWASGDKGGAVALLKCKAGAA